MPTPFSRIAPPGQTSSTPGSASGTPFGPAASTRCLKDCVNQAGGALLGWSTCAAAAVPAPPVINPIETTANSSARLRMEEPP